MELGICLVGDYNFGKFMSPGCSITMMLLGVSISSIFLGVVVCVGANALSVACVVPKLVGYEDPRALVFATLVDLCPLEALTM